jgi:hypothetical protein
MLSPNIVRHYVYAVTQCRNHPIDAVTDTATFWGLRTAIVAQFLRTIGAHGADRLGNI